MTALPDYRHEPPRNLSEKVIARLPESAFGNTEWVTMTARTGAEYLRAAISSNRPHRVANAVRSMAHAPSLDDVEVLATTICDTIVADAYAVRNSEMIAQIANARRVVTSVVAEVRNNVSPASPELALLCEMVDGYVRLIGLHDSFISERLNAVGAFAKRVARSMNLPAADILDAELAGRLHDIGMVDMPRTNRAKAIVLSKEDHDRFKRHPVTGEAFLSSIPSLARLAPIVRSHHERYDGQGYPDGLYRDEIPLASRIISVATTFVDLVTETPQLEAMLPHDACRELLRHAGAEFDPDVVTATLHLLRFRQRTNRSA